MCVHSASTINSLFSDRKFQINRCHTCIGQRGQLSPKIDIAKAQNIKLVSLFYEVAVAILTVFKMDLYLDDDKP